MKNRRVALFFVLSAMMVCGSVFAASPDELRAREELQAWYGKIVDSYRNKDLEAFMALYSKDVKIRNAQGETKDRKALKAFARQDMTATGEIHSAKFEIRKVALKGREATAAGDEIWEYVFTDLKGEFGPKGKSYDVVWRSPVRCKFLKTWDGWVVKYREMTGPEQLTTGGRPLVPLLESKKQESKKQKK